MNALPWSSRPADRLVEAIDCLSPGHLKIILADIRAAFSREAYRAAERRLVVRATDGIATKPYWLAGELVRGAIDRQIRRSGWFNDETDAALVSFALETAAAAAILQQVLDPAELLELVAPVRSLIASDDLVVDDLAFLFVRMPHPIKSLRRRLVDQIGEDSVFVLEVRQHHTLEWIAGRQGVTRERIRQRESRARRALEWLLMDDAPELLAHLRDRLKSSVAFEGEIFSGLLGESDHDFVRPFARAVLEVLGGVQPRAFDGSRMESWWTMEPGAIRDEVDNLDFLFPCRHSDFEQILHQYPLSVGSAIEVILSRPRAPVMRHPLLTDVWVHRIGKDADAAYVLLLDSGQPIATERLAEAVGQRVNGMAEALRRDDRFIYLGRATGWGLEGKDGTRAPTRTTMGVVLEVLEAAGPLTYRDLVERVQAIYSVTDAAVYQCLAHREIGRQPDGRIDLVSRGAVVKARGGRARPSERVQIAESDLIVFTQQVNQDVLRGSGLGLPPLVTQALGLTEVPMSRTFLTRAPDNSPNLVISRRIHGSTISSLREHALELRAQAGCTLCVTLQPLSDSATVELACDHSHRE